MKTIYSFKEDTTPLIAAVLLRRYRDTVRVDLLDLNGDPIYAFSHECTEADPGCIVPFGEKMPSEEFRAKVTAFYRLWDDGPDGAK